MHTVKNEYWNINPQELAEKVGTKYKSNTEQRMKTDTIQETTDARKDTCHKHRCQGIPKCCIPFCLSTTYDQPWFLSLKSVLMKVTNINHNAWEVPVGA